MRCSSRPFLTSSRVCVSDAYLCQRVEALVHTEVVDELAESVAVDALAEVERLGRGQLKPLLDFFGVFVLLLALAENLGVPEGQVADGELLRVRVHFGVDLVGLFEQVFPLDLEYGVIGLEV